MVFKKCFLILLILLFLTSCFGFKEKNELALPPFFKEEYKQMNKKK